MAGTEDIAEKVADLLIQESARAGARILDTAPVIVDGVVRQGKDITKSLFETASKTTKKGQLKSLEQQGAKLPLTKFWAVAKRMGYETDTLKLADADSQDFEHLLRKEKMVFTCLSNKEDDYNVFIFFRKDSEKVKKAYDTLQARRGTVTELSPDDFLNAVEPEKLRVLSNVDEVEAELFRYFAREHGLLFAHIPGEGEQPGQIIYQPQDAEKARQVMLSMGWALTSEDGARIRQQVQHYLKGRSAINISIEEGAKELFVVSSVNPGNVVHITEQDYQLYKGGAFIKAESRTQADFYTKCMAACMAINGAVVLTRDEFEAPETTQDTIQQMPTIDLFPRDTISVTDDGYLNNLHDGYDTVFAQDQINELYHLVSRKMALDNEGNANWGAFDPSVSFSEFAGYEHYQDVEEQEGREVAFEHFKKAAFYGQDNFDPQEVDMTDRSIDYIISRAYIRSGTRPEPEQEVRTHKVDVQDR